LDDGQHRGCFPHRNNRYQQDNMQNLSSVITQQTLGGGGRLGNQMFGIACLIGTAKKYGITPQIGEWYYAKYFNKDIRAANIPEPDMHHYEPHFHYSPIELTGQEKCINLHGYYQSEKYFENAEQEVRDIFEFSDHIKKATDEKFGNWFGPYCSIHVRRGDYTNNPYYATLTDDYYMSAINYIVEKTVITNFVVFSDDINWCRNNFLKNDSKRPSEIRFIFMEDLTPIADMCLMSKCHSNIIANSSFSWWGAWLNTNKDKIVIAPKEWFGPAANLNAKDLYTQNMVLI
jgi:hypothetical protein